MGAKIMMGGGGLIGAGFACFILFVAMPQVTFLQTAGIIIIACGVIALTIGLLIKMVLPDF